MARVDSCNKLFGRGPPAKKLWRRLSLVFFVGIAGGAFVSRRLRLFSCTTIACVYGTNRLLLKGLSRAQNCALPNLSPFPPELPVSRKYRQDGYMDGDREKRERKQAPASAPRQEMTFGPRFIHMPGTRSLSRCAMCGTVLQESAGSLGQCSKCGAELHSCRQCTSFDTGSKFECMQPVPERVSDKTARNECSFFSLRVKVEKETSTGPAQVNDARAAFDRLFKK